MKSTNKAADQMIIARTGPCRCGCKGTDPHHRATFHRTVRNIRFGAAEVTDCRGLPHVDGALLGTVKLPWGIETVKMSAFETRGRWTAVGAWTVA